MIIKKTWRYGIKFISSDTYVKYNYTGYFLLGIIPIFIIRE